MGFHSGLLESCIVFPRRKVVAVHSRGTHSLVVHTPENGFRRGKWCYLPRSYLDRSDRIDHRSRFHQESMIVCQTNANNRRPSRRKKMQPPLCSGSLLVHYTGLRIARVRIARYLGGIQGLLGILLVHPRSHIGCHLARRSGVHWAYISIRPACRCHHMNARRRRPGTYRSRSPSVRSIGRYCCRAEYFLRRHIVDCLVGKHPSRRHSQRYHPPPQMHQRRKRDRPQHIRPTTKQKSE